MMVVTQVINLNLICLSCSITSINTHKRMVTEGETRIATFHIQSAKNQKEKRT